MKALVRPVETVVATRWDKHGDHAAVEQRTADSDDEDLNQEIGWLGDTPVYPGDWVLDVGRRAIVVRASEFATKYEVMEEISE